jgi:hypothetical protein
MKCTCTDEKIARMTSNLRPTLSGDAWLGGDSEQVVVSVPFDAHYLFPCPKV